MKQLLQAADWDEYRGVSGWGGGKRARGGELELGGRGLQAGGCCDDPGNAVKEARSSLFSPRIRQRAL